MDSVEKRGAMGHAPEADHAAPLAAALKLDMAAYWQPTAASYFSKVSKALILEAVTEGVSREAAENLAALKKKALCPMSGPDVAAGAGRRGRSGGAEQRGKPARAGKPLLRVVGQRVFLQRREGVRRGRSGNRAG